MDLRETLLAFHCCWRVFFLTLGYCYFFISTRADSNQYFLHFADRLMPWENIHEFASVMQ